MCQPKFRSEYEIFDSYSKTPNKFAVILDASTQNTQQNIFAVCIWGLFSFFFKTNLLGGYDRFR